MPSPGRLALLSFFTLAACASPAATDDDTTAAGQDIVGGSRDARWAASGYLVSGPSLEALAHPAKAECGATLIAPNVVVTAAHCVLRAESATWAFGTGDVGSGALVEVVDRKVHPEFHARPEGMIDVPYFLRKNDVAYLILAHALATPPAELPRADPEDACNVQAIGYHAESAGKTPARVSTPACVEFKVSLGDDPIFEVHPQNRSGLCTADGDEGSPVVLRDASRDVLVGIFVGSVTQGITDCRKSVQLLDGYESAYGYRAFFEEGIARGKTRL